MRYQPGPQFYFRGGSFHSGKQLFIARHWKKGFDNKVWGVLEFVSTLIRGWGWWLCGCMFCQNLHKYTQRREWYVNLKGLKERRKCGSLPGLCVDRKPQFFSSGASPSCFEFAPAVVAGCPRSKPSKEASGGNYPFYGAWRSPSITSIIFY